MPPLPETILFYDGLCGLCDRLIQFILEHDRNGRIYFIPIQAATAQQELLKRGASSAELVELSTVYFLDGGVLYRRSRAVFRALGYLPPPWSWIQVFLILPAFLTDPAYRVIAALRYRIFGRLDQCRIPAEEEKKRFLS